uniref:Uncharacterized protein n=1 Tax=Oryza punctata TaxID=4537 RepID=A0A0E0JVJ8_ORYPU
MRWRRWKYSLSVACLALVLLAAAAAARGAAIGGVARARARHVATATHTGGGGGRVVVASSTAAFDATFTAASRCRKQRSSRGGVAAGCGWSPPAAAIDDERVVPTGSNPLHNR